MGLSNSISDVQTNSIPILLVVVAAGWVSYIRSLLLCLLHNLGLHRLDSSDHTPSATATATATATGSGLAGLVALTNYLTSSRAFPYAGEGPDCVVCLCCIRDGDSVRSLPCHHVFHSQCLDGWFDQMNLSCPLCRSPLVREDWRADDERRIGAELVAWLSLH